MNSPAASKLDSYFTQFIHSLGERPWWGIIIWAVAYLTALLPLAARPLWFDELITFYVARQPTFSRLFASINHVDLNPPLSYLAVRACTRVFGESPAIVRLTSLVCFFAAGLLLFQLVRRRLGGRFGLLALGLFLECGYLRFAVEARPYAMMLAFYSLAALSWFDATEKRSWSWAHWGLMTGLAGLILTHCFGPIYSASLGCGELLRTILNRRVDRRVWAALLIPLPLGLTYLSMTQLTGLAFPSAFQARLETIPWVYNGLFRSLLPSLFAMLLLLMWRDPKRSFWSVLRPHELAFAISGLLTPLLIISYALHTHIAFWPRYAIGFTVGTVVILVFVFAWLSGGRGPSAVQAAIAVFVVFCIQQIPAPKPLPVSTAYRKVCPNLPFVTASGLTFVEMDHREPENFTKRLYYLTNHEAAVQFHATIFEGFSTMKEWFPIRANVQPYNEFVADHPYFVVLATPAFPEDWLMSKLNSDGAQLRYLGSLPTGYRDEMLFEVRIHAHGDAGRSESASVPNDNCGIPQNQAAIGSKDWLGARSN